MLAGGRVAASVPGFVQTRLFPPQAVAIDVDAGQRHRARQPSSPSSSNKSAPAAAPAAKPASAELDPLDLLYFLRAIGLGTYFIKFRDELGCASVHDISFLTDEDLKNAGMKTVEIRKLRARLPQPASPSGESLRPGDKYQVQYPRTVPRAGDIYERF